MDIGDILKSYRKKAKLSRKEVADMLGMSVSSVGHWENNDNKPTYDNITNLAKIYNVPRTNLLGEDEVTPLDNNKKESLLKNALEMLHESGAFENVKNYEDLSEYSKSVIELTIMQFIEEKSKTKKETPAK